MKKLIQNIWIDNNRKQIRNPVIIKRQKRPIKSLSYLDSLHNAAAQILIDLNYYDNLDELLERINQIQKIRKDDENFEKDDDITIENEMVSNLFVPDVRALN